MYLFGITTFLVHFARVRNIIKYSIRFLISCVSRKPSLISIYLIKWSTREIGFQYSVIPDCDQWNNWPYPFFFFLHILYSLTISISYFEKTKLFPDLIRIPNDREWIRNILYVQYMACITKKPCVASWTSSSFHSLIDYVFFQVQTPAYLQKQSVFFPMRIF